MEMISIDELRNLVGKMKNRESFPAGEGAYGELTDLLIDLWNTAGHTYLEHAEKCDREELGYTFAEVVKARNRMCNGIDCGGCPLKGSFCYDISLLRTDERIAELENAVMSWAKEHPEMRYPTCANGVTRISPRL